MRADDGKSELTPIDGHFKPINFEDITIKFDMVKCRGTNNIELLKKDCVLKMILICAESIRGSWLSWRPLIVMFTE